MRIVLAVLACAMAAALVAPPTAASPPPSPRPELTVDDFRRVLARLKARRPDGKGKPVTFRFNHHFDDAPEVVFTEIARVDGKTVLVRKIWTHEVTFAKGDLIEGVLVQDITRTHAVCSYRNRTWNVAPKPRPPTITCTKIERKGEDWIASLSVAGEPGEYRSGDEIQGAQIAAVTADAVECQYYGIKGVLRPLRAFPAIPCRLTSATPQGWQVYVQDSDTIKLLRTGDVYQEARVKAIDRDGVTFEFEGQEQRFPVPELPALVYTGCSTMGGRTFAYLELRGKQHQASPGQKLELDGHSLTIDEVSPALVKYRFNGIPLELARH